MTAILWPILAVALLLASNGHVEAQSAGSLSVSLSTISESNFANGATKDVVLTLTGDLRFAGDGGAGRRRAGGGERHKDGRHFDATTGLPGAKAFAAFSLVSAPPGLRITQVKRPTPFPSRPENKGGKGGNTATMTLSFKGGIAGNVTFSVRVAADALVRGNGTGWCDTGHVDFDEGLCPPVTATMTMVADVDTPFVTLTLNPSMVSEKGGVSKVTATLNEPLNAATTVTVSATPVAPAVARDINLSTNKVLTIAAGATASTGVVTVTGIDNAVDAPDKRVRVSAMVSNTQEEVAMPADAILKLTDDDDNFRPAKPTGFWAASSDGALTLNWNDPSDATITRYQYQIKKARSSWHGWKAIPNSGAATTSHTVTGLDNATAYTLRIRAFDRGGVGAASKYVRATPGAAAASDALTARVAGPVRHLGMWRFIVWIEFSEPVTIRAKEAAKLLSPRATNGTVYYARRAGGADRWEIRVQRASQAPVTITLSATSYCRAPDAVCTADGRFLSQELSFTVPLVPALRVSNARVREGTGATADFRVSMGRAAAGTVTVDYATEDGTATAGTDYTATSGTLTFAAGETSKTVSVPVIDDAVDEGRETFTLRLSNARGARLFDDVGKGIIKNADPLPKAWLARFGRTVGTRVTDAVSARLRASPGQGSSLTVGGYRVPLGKPAGGATNKSVTAPTDAEDSASALLQGLAGVLGMGPAQSGAGGPWDEANGRGPDPRLGQSQPLNLDLRQLLLGSSFRLSLTAADADAGPRLTAWGRFAGTTFDGRDERDLTVVDVDGDVFTGTVGVDGAWDRFLAGVAVAHSRGDGSFTDTNPGMADRGQGDLEQTLTSIHPYLRYAVTDRLDVWGLVGYGWGELDLEQSNGRTLETDTTLVMGAFGSRGILFSPADTGGFQLATRTDAMLTRTSSDKVAGMEGADADAHRVRLILEGSRGITWADGRSLTPTVELGLRHDWGDAETGFGLELGGRVQYADPGLGLTVEAAVRGLVAHEDDDYDEWGAWGTVQVAPDAGGRGLALTLAPT